MARGCFLEDACFFHVVHAAGTRTPHKVWVQIHVYVQLKLEVLLVDLFLAELLDVNLLKSLFAADHHAWDVNHVAILNMHHQVVLKALFATLMITIQAKECILWLIFVANIARTLRFGWQCRLLSNQTP